ncbi:hypothetical protein AB0N86_30750, partial [Streptomyces sp. NPDC093023]
AASAVLLDEGTGHDGATYELTGPKAFTLADAARGPHHHRSTRPGAAVPPRQPPVAGEDSGGIVFQNP